MKAHRATRFHMKLVEESEIKEMEKKYNFMGYVVVDITKQSNGLWLLTATESTQRISLRTLLDC